MTDVDDRLPSIQREATRADFVANVSHELKGPMGLIAMLAEAVLDAAEDAVEVRLLAGKILSESIRLGALVTELIGLSQLELGDSATPPPDLTEVDVDTVVAEAISRVTLTARAGKIHAASDGYSGLLVKGNRTLLVTALSNLLANAVVYSPMGSPVSVSRRLVGGFVDIAVVDHGLGVAEDERQRVFERFYRGEKARSRATGGTGLGLAIVKHIADYHGGMVKLRSKPSVGSTFTLCVPAVRPADTLGRPVTSEEEQ